MVEAIMKADKQEKTQFDFLHTDHKINAQRVAKKAGTSYLFSQRNNKLVSL